jgi:hypothetical protein
MIHCVFTYSICVWFPYLFWCVLVPILNLIYAVWAERMRSWSRHHGSVMYFLPGWSVSPLIARVSAGPRLRAGFSVLVAYGSLRSRISHSCLVQHLQVSILDRGSSNYVKILWFIFVRICLYVLRIQEVPNSLHLVYDAVPSYTNVCIVLYIWWKSVTKQRL